MQSSGFLSPPPPRATVLSDRWFCAGGEGVQPAPGGVLHHPSLRLEGWSNPRILIFFLPCCIPPEKKCHFHVFFANLWGKKSPGNTIFGHFKIPTKSTTWAGTSRCPGPTCLSGAGSGRPRPNQTANNANFLSPKLAKSLAKCHFWHFVSKFLSDYFGTKLRKRKLTFWGLGSPPPPDFFFYPIPMIIPTQSEDRVIGR